ncbi:HlyD family secretion protein [Albibacterium bauzanense]|uniref:HlyD family secretion protein n=1 Tax=Albibacterium bauzanense TaxID=653929 RepID=A0A4R1LYU9_9SPHI|nr:HlyD family efflux transporter periplasmic adaptor subunit [Albibacterium bauzanense]TCK84728.1 HlyD family secretion protein [Albibacterium bauzanense]
MKGLKLVLLASVIVLGSCGRNDNDYDASGNFEADEVIVSAEQNGELLSFNIKEGEQLDAGAKVGQIDIILAQLQKEQTEAAITALKEKTSDAGEQTALVQRQLAVEESQLDHLIKERERTRNLVKADAATQKQLDDMNAQIDQQQKRINVTKQQIRLNTSNTATQNRSILSERGPLEKMVEQYQEQIKKGEVINPINGTVLAAYALKGEMAIIGKPLYKIANTDTLNLRAYITGEQLPQIKIGDEIEVRIDSGATGFKSYPGSITWIASKSEFTPKTIQTKNERANQVYAIKISVPNDGYLKIGMYGEVLFK